MKKSYVLLLLLVTITLAGCGKSKRTLSDILDDGVLRVVVNAEFAPFEYQEGGVFKGFDIDLIKAYGDYLGVKVEITHTDFDAALLSASSGKHDLVISAVTANAIRRESMSFSNGYYTASQVVIVPNEYPYDTSTEAEILVNLSNKRIGVQRATTAQYYVEGSNDWGFPGINGATCLTYDNGSLAVKDLENGNIDAVIIDAAPAQFLVEHSDKVKKLNVLLTQEEYAIATWHGNETLVNSINQFLEMFIASNQYKELLAIHFGNNE